MKTLVTKISIGKYTFQYVNECVIQRNIQSLTNTTSIILPRKIQFKEGSIKSEIKKGDEISIELGYDKAAPVFKGFVSGVKAGLPIEISAEDLMWKLKQIEIQGIANNEKLNEFLQRLIPYEIDCFPIELKRYVIEPMSIAKALDKIKTDFGLYVFVRNNIIVIGKQYNAQNYSKHILRLNFNTVEDDLEYKSVDDIKLKLILISNLSDGNKIEYEFGDDGGDVRTLNYFDLSESELKKLAQNEYDKLIYEGFRGTITAFGEPFIQDGDVVEIQSNIEPVRNGSYWVDEVVYTFGVSGYRQVITLGPKT